MIASKDFPGLRREELLALAAELQHQIAELRASHEALRAEIEQCNRGGK
jgi:prefoldin subunit 5